MDGSACFHRLDLCPLLKRQARSAEALWKSLNPSEDGEALVLNDSAGLPVDFGSELAGGRDAIAASTWFAVYPTCRHEKRVARHLNQREIEYFLPLYVAHRKGSDGSKVALELPLFPCY